MKRVALVLSLLVCAATSASAQLGRAPSGPCAFDVTWTGGSTTIELPSGQRNTYLGGNVVASCPSQRLVLKSDSLEIYGDEGRFFFVGHVDYREPRLQLKSDFLTYFQREERLLAFLNVDATLPTGSTLKGPQLEYWRALPNVRQQRANAIARPTITIIEKDSAGVAQPPVTVTGNTIWLEGDSTVASSGQVSVVRPELTATGDSLYLHGGTGLLRLMRTPRVVGTKGRPFTLVGETIDVLSKQRKLERVLAKGSAEATSQDLNLKSDSIDLRISNDVLQRAISWGKSRSRAVSPAQSVIADSIDVLLPDQRVREMHAIRGAVAEGAPDTTKFRTPEKDRLTGDTIVAHFDTASAVVRDTTSKPRIRLLVSTGHATSLQHLPARDSSLRKPAVVYVVGRDITVTFDSGAVKRVSVRDQALSSGVYIEPKSDSVRAQPSGLAPGSTAPAPSSATPSSPSPSPTPAPPPSRPTTSPAVPPRRP